MKKILSLILAGLMTLSCAAFVAADDAAVDAAVEQTNTAEDYAIEFLANYGIFKGTSAAELVADAASPIQRYQMALFVSRISTGWVDDAQWEDGPANNSTFEDIGEEPANKYLGALSYANQNGIIEGYSPRTFAPYDGITYRDALTMVVRTLGYKGLAYPWGYIEKAVELGLTADVNVAYTDNLTRGQVAVIIYNAMFANTKSGETLAKKIFDCDFGWENIVIVASNEAAFMNNGKYASNGYVAFKLLNDKGGLSEKTYYVKKAELGLNGDHDDELQVGAAYVALFTVKDDIATMVDADSLNYKTVYNLGITDNAGETLATMPLAAELANYNVVKEYQKPEIISSPDKHEMIVYGTGVTQVTDTNGKRIAIDWNTQNILKWVDAKDGVAAHWETAWVYNPTLNRYYQYDVDTYGKLYINWMSDKEFEEFYAKAVTYVKDTLAEYVNRENANGMNDSAYSKLRMFDTNGDGLAERALFKMYDIGQISVGSAICDRNANNVNHVDGKYYPTYKITTLDGAPVYEQFIEKDHTAHEGLEKGTNLNGKQSDHFAWLNVADFVTTFYKEDGSFENGSIVLYNVNKTTGEIEIIKHITTKGSASDDADSYIATGILKGYSTKNATVTIDGEKMSLGYGALRSSIYGNVNHCLACRAAAAESLDTMLLQYVTYVVVDGRVVDIDLRGATSHTIVVLGYAGITSDGYIAVYGYGTDDTSAKIYRIASYNGWKKGDYRYYPANAWADEAFVAGTVYNVTSYDDATKSYNVYTENTDKDAKDGLDVVNYTFDSGYRVINNITTGANNIVKMSKDDKYVVIFNNGSIFVKTGVVSDSTWELQGKSRVLDNGKTIVVYVDRTIPTDKVVGFDETANEIGFVLYDKKTGRTLEAAYDDAIGGDWYLLGSTQSEVRVTDLLTGNVDTCFVSNNIDLVKGRVYLTYNFGDSRMIINQVDDEDNGSGYPGFIAGAAWMYRETNVSDARFMVTQNPIEFTDADADGVRDNKGDSYYSNLKYMIANELGLLPNSTNTEIVKKFVKANINDVIFFNITNSASDKITLDKIDVEELENVGSYFSTIVNVKLDTADTYKAAAIYDVNTKNVVVYIYAESTIDRSTTVSGTNNIWNWKYKSSVKESSLNTLWTGSYDASRKETVINMLDLGFTTLGENDGDIAMNGYLFGLDKEHGRSYFSYNDTRILVDGVEKYVVSNGDIALLRYVDREGHTCADCSLVAGINAKTNIVIGANQIVKVTFEVVGNNPVYDANGIGYSTGNNITVEVEFKTDAYGYLLTDANGNITGVTVTNVIINTINGNLDSALNNVDLETLKTLGVDMAE